MANPSTVVAKVLQGKYFHNVSFLAAKVPGGASFMWWSIVEARALLIQGMDGEFYGKKVNV